MRIRLKGKYFIGLVWLLCISCLDFPMTYAQQKVTIPNSPTDFPPAFECVFFPDFENNFSIREAARTDTTTIDLVMPLVGDVTGDGYPEILIPARQVNIGSDNDGYGRPYITSRTKDILVYSMGFDGGGNEVLTLIDRIITPYYSIEAPAQFVLAKVDGGRPLVIVAASWDPDNGADASRLVAFQYNGANFARRWTSDQKYGRNVPWSSKQLTIDALNPGVLKNYKFPSGGSPSVADFDGNGVPEVYVYNEIFNAVTGQFIVDGGRLRNPSDTTLFMGQGISQVSPGNDDQMYAGTTAVSVAADLNNSGNLELAAGNTIYLVNIAAQTMTPIFAPNSINGQFPRDGYTSVADIDGDGQLDVLVTATRNKADPNSRQLYAWTLPSGTGPLAANNGVLRTFLDFDSSDFSDVAMSLAFIGDVNGDKKPNIGFNTPYRLWMLTYDGGSNSFVGTWNAIGNIATNDGSGHTYITMFDFDQNGRQDLVYRDETRLRIIDGITGIDQSSFPSFSATANEGAIVADVDLDGEAEIIVTDRQRALGVDALNRTAAMVVYKSDTKPWAPARKVWNQYAYFAFNVNQDLTIPAPQQNHARTAGQYFPKYDIFGCLLADEQPFNNFLVQTTLYNDAGCQTTGINLMNAEIEILASRFFCPAPDQSIEFEYTVRNESDAIGDATAAIPTDTPIAFYVDGTFIGQFTLAELGIPSLLPGQEFSLTTVIPSSVSDLLTTNTQSFQAIINWDHASQNVIYEECIYDNTSDFLLISRPLYSINNPAPLCFEDASGQINSFLLTPQNTVPGSVDSDQLQWFLNDLTSAPLTNNVTYTIDPTDFSLTIVGLNPGTYTFYLLDGCTDVSVNTQITVNPLPSPVFSLVDAECFNESTGQILVDSHLNGYVYYVTGMLFDGSQFAEVRFDSETSLESAGFKAGEYSIRTVNENGTNCQLITLVEISQPTQIELTGVIENSPECEPDNGSISWTIIGGSPSSTFPFYSYTLTNSGTGSVDSSPTIEDLGSGRVGIQNLEGGNYVLTSTDQNGCSLNQSFTLITQVDPEFTTPQDITICEGEDATASITMTNPGTPAANPNYIWGTFTGGVFSALTNGQSVAGGTINIAPDGLTATFQNLSPNPSGHEFAVRIENACNQADSPFLIKVNPFPTIEVAVKNITCFGGNDGEITLTKSPSANPSDSYEYTLTETGATNTTGIFTGLVFQANPYTISIKNLATQCQTSVEATLTQAEEIVIQNLVDVSSTCMDSNGTLSATITGGVGPYEVALVQGGTELKKIPSTGNFTLSDLAAGDYELVAFDAVGCKSQAIPFTILNDNKTPIVIVLSPIETCEGELVVLRPDINTQGLPRTLTWYKDAAKTDLIKTGPDAVDPAVIYNLDGEKLEIIGLKEGITKFYLDVTGTDYCPIEPTEVIVTVTPALKLDLDIPDEICFGEGVTVVANGSGGNGQIEYSLDGGAFQTSNTFNLVPAGTHKLTIRTNQGCSLTNDFTVVGPSAPIAVSNDPVILSSSCGLANGEISNIFVTGGYGNYTFIWKKDNVQNPVNYAEGVLELKDLFAGDYYLIITDEKGCELVVPFEVEELPDPEVVITDIAVCGQQQVTLTPVQTVSGAAPTELIWYFDAARTKLISSLVDPADANINYAINSDSELTIQGLPFGEYSYFLEVVCTGALIESKVSINENPAPVFETTDILCFGDNSGKIKVSSGDNSDLLYSVNGAPGINRTSLESLNFSAGTYAINITNQQTGCNSQQTLVLTEPSELIFLPGPFVNPTCGESNGSIRFDLSGGVPAYEILINNAAISAFTFSENQGTYSLSGLAPGSYNINVKDKNGCVLNLANQFQLVNNEGTLITIEKMEGATCVGQVASIIPKISTSSGKMPTVQWFTDSLLTKPITPNYDPNGTGLMYEIINSTGEIRIYNLGLGSYSYYLQLSGTEFCTTSAKATVEVALGLVATSQITDLICFGANDGKIEIDASQNSNAVLEYSKDGTVWQSQPLFDKLAAGVYEITIRDKSGNFNCELKLPGLEVKGPSAPITINPDIIVQRSSCGLDNGSITNIQIQGGWGTYQIEWRKDSPTGTLISGNANSAENLVPGKYFLIVQDLEGCEEIFEFEITAQNQPLYSIIEPNDICEGESITLEAINSVSGASSTGYVWSKGPNKQNPIAEGGDSAIPGAIYAFDEIDTRLLLNIQGLPAGVYTYYLFIDCTSQELLFEFEVKASPSPVIEKTDISCFGQNDGKIIVNSGGAPDFTYSVNNGTKISQAALESQNFAPGIYEILVSNSIGCSSQVYTLEIVEPAALEIEDLSFKNSACGSNDGEILISWFGGTAEYTIQLIRNGAVISSKKSSSFSTSFNNLGAGTYEVSIVDANLCSVKSLAPIVLVDGPSEIIAEDVSVCVGEIAVIQPKVNPASANPLYSWYWGSISAVNKLNNGDKRGTVDIQINAAGEIRLAGVPAGTSQTLVVTVSGPGICEGDEKQVVVSVKDAPEFTAVGNDELCFGDGGSIQISSADLIGLEFSINSGPFTTYPSGLIENLAPGSYTLAGKNTTGCVTNLGQTIIINGPASALNFEDFKVLPSSCLSSDGEISGIIGGGTSPYIVSLKDSQGVKISSDIQTADGVFLFSSLLAGSYQVDVIDGNGCLISNDSIQLLDEPAVISANDVSICEGEIATIQASFSQNISNVTYNWYYDAALTQPVQLNAAADSYGAQYQSAASGRLSITSLPARNNPYSYFIQVTGQGVCPPEVKEVKVTVSPLPTLRVSNPSIVCDPNQTVDLTEFIEGYNPNIFDYKVISPTGTALRRDELSAVKTTGSYIVQAAFKGNTCFTPVERIAVVIATTQLQSSFDYQIEFANSTIVVNGDVQAFEDVDFMDTSVGEAIIWNWDFGDGTVSSEQNPTHEYLDAGEFLVKLTTIDRFGCVSEFQRVLEIFNDYQIIIPNAFTPGGVKNQYFLPKYRGISSMEFYIFTTWGELIFETNSLETLGWDGTFRGRPAMNGNYVYNAVFNTRTGEVVERAGVFVLIR